MNPAAWIPFEYPEAWGVSDLSLLAGTPFNCILTPAERRDVRTGAEARGLAAPADFNWSAWGEVDWRNAGELVAVRNGYWPDLSMRGATGESAGPTGDAWLDANGWLLELLRARAGKNRTIWIKSEPPENLANLQTSSYELAAAEAFAYGARRPVWIAPDLAAGLAKGNAKAASAWSALCGTIAWLEERRDWGLWPTDARLTVVSDFAGPNEYISSETLLLCARRGLPFSVVETSRLSTAALTGIKAVLYCDASPPARDQLAVLRRFVESGGLLLSARNAAIGLGGMKAASERHNRFDIMSLGRGKVAVAKAGLDDPYLLAQDAHLLMSRRWDPIRLFNAGSIQWRFVMSPDHKRGLAHLLNFSRRPAAHQVSLAPSMKVHFGILHTAGTEQPRRLSPQSEDGRIEFHVPPFTVYSAVEFELA